MSRFVRSTENYTATWLSQPSMGTVAYSSCCAPIYIFTCAWVIFHSKWVGFLQVLWLSSHLQGLAIKIGCPADWDDSLLCARLKCPQEDQLPSQLCFAQSTQSFNREDFQVTTGCTVDCLQRVLPVYAAVEWYLATTLHWGSSWRHLLRLEEGLKETLAGSV